MLDPYYHFILFFFTDTATTEIYTLSLHDALPIWVSGLYRCRSYVRPVIVHSPGPWATADAVSTIMLAAMPPDSSLKRFIADLMLRMRVERKTVHATCLSALLTLVSNVRARAFPTGHSHRPNYLQ